MKIRKHQELWQEGMDNRNCPKCGRYMRTSESNDEDFFAYACNNDSCDILVIVK